MASLWQFLGFKFIYSAWHSSRQTTRLSQDLSPLFIQRLCAFSVFRLVFQNTSTSTSASAVTLFQRNDCPIIFSRKVLHLLTMLTFQVQESLYCRRSSQTLHHYILFWDLIIAVPCLHHRFLKKGTPSPDDADIPALWFFVLSSLSYFTFCHWWYAPFWWSDCRIWKISVLSSQTSVFHRRYAPFRWYWCA